MAFAASSAVACILRRSREGATCWRFGWGRALDSGSKLPHSTRWRAVRWLHPQATNQDWQNALRAAPVNSHAVPVGRNAVREVRIRVREGKIAISECQKSSVFGPKLAVLLGKWSFALARLPAACKAGYGMQDFWKGFRMTLGAGVATSLLTLLALCISPLREWVTHRFSGHATAGRIDLTIFLLVLCSVLFGLLIWSRIAHSRFRMRVYEKKVTDDELHPEMMKHVFRNLSASDEKFYPKLGFFDKVLSWLMRR